MEQSVPAWHMAGCKNGNGLRGADAVQAAPARYARGIHATTGDRLRCEGEDEDEGEDDYEDDCEDDCEDDGEDVTRAITRTITRATTRATTRAITRAITSTMTTAVTSTVADNPPISGGRHERCGCAVWLRTTGRPHPPGV